MGNEPAKPGNSQQPEKPAAPVQATGSAPNPIKILIADSQAIYRVGIRKIFALEDDLRVVAQAESLGQTLAAASRFEPDVVLMESALSPNPAGAVAEVQKRAPNAKLIIIAGESDEDDTVEYLRRGVRGIIKRSVAPELLIKCVRKVAEGETWLDNQGVNWVIEAYRTQTAHPGAAKPKGRLTDKELLIVACVTQGMKNKEIATEVGTTEQVVKNYLRKVYDKLGVSDRLELALYCIHHRLLQGVRVPRPGEASPAKPVAGVGPSEAASASGHKA
ncbi:MAG: response regulator transcription factor [Terriglobales bacterium]